MMADHIGPLSHLHAKDTSFVLVSRAPLAKLLAFRDRMGWTLPWVSSESTTFNEDFGATVDGEERQAISVFLRDGDRVFHTWSTYARGEEPFMVVFDLLDLTPYGRQETWEDSPAGWPQQPPYEWMRLHDSYWVSAWTERRQRRRNPTSSVTLRAQLSAEFIEIIVSVNYA